MKMVYLDLVTFPESVSIYVDQLMFLKLLSDNTSSTVKSVLMAISINQAT